MSAGRVHRALHAESPEASVAGGHRAARGDRRAALTAERRSTVFVYGTLLAGEPNHHVLGDATCLGPNRTPAAFTLVDLGYFPGMVAGGPTAVEGEVYRVDAEMLAALDRLEGHPWLYWRVPITLEDGMLAFAYLLAPHRATNSQAVRSGSWRQHRKERP